MPIGRRPAEETLDDILAELTGIRQIFENNRKASGSNQNNMNRAGSQPNGQNSQNVKNAVLGSLSPDAVKNSVGIASGLTSIANAWLALVSGALKITKAEKKIEKATQIVTNVVNTMNTAINSDFDSEKLSKSLGGIANFFEALGKLKFKSVFAFWMYNKLITPKVMQNFVKGLSYFADAPNVKDVDFRGIGMMIDSIGDTVVKLTVVAGALTVLLQYMPITDLAISLLVVGGIVVGLATIVTALSFISGRMKKGAEALSGVADALIKVTVAVGLLIILATAIKLLGAIFGWNATGEISTGIEMLVGGIAIGIMQGLSLFASKKWGDKSKGEVQKGVLWVAALIGLLIIDLFGLILLAKVQQKIPWDLLAKLGVMMIGVVASTAILNLFSSSDGDGKQAMYSIMGIGILIGLLVIDLALLALLVQLFPESTINTALNIMQLFLGGITVIVALLAGMAAALAINNMTNLTRNILGGNAVTNIIARQQNPVFQTLLGISILVLSLSASLWITASLIKKEGIGNVSLGLILMMTFLGGMIGIVKLLEHIKPKRITIGLQILAAIEALCLGLSGIVFVFVKAAREAATLTTDEVLSYMAVVGGMIVGLTALALLVAANGYVIAAVAIALGVLVVYEGFMLAAQGVMWTFMTMVKAIKKWNIDPKKDADLYYNTFNEIIDGLTRTSIHLIDSMGPLDFLKAGAGITLIMSLVPVFIAMGKVMNQFVDVMAKIKKSGIKASDIVVKNSDGKVIHEGPFFQIFNGLIDGIISFGNKIKKDGLNLRSAWIMKSLGKAILPLIDACSKFVNIIISMKNAKMPKTFDEKGNVTEWQTISDVDFTNAANAISGAFKTFLEGLIEKTQTMNVTTGRALKYLSKSIVPIMQGVSGFVDAILKLAVGQVHIGEEDYIDENGEHRTRPKYVEVTDAMFEDAASKITEQFGAFIDKLKEELNNMQPQTSAMIKQLGQGLGPILSSISSYVDAIMKFAGGYIISGEEAVTDKNGNIVIVKKWTKLGVNDITTAASNITTMITGFLTGLGASLKQMDDEGSLDLIKENIDSVTGVFTSLFGTVDKPGPISSLIQLAGAMAINKFPIGKDDKGVMQYLEVPRGAGAINDTAYAITTIMYTFVHGLWQKFHNYGNRWKSLTNAAEQVKNIITTLVSGEESPLALLIHANEDLKKAGRLRSASDLITVIFGKDFDTKIIQLSGVTEKIDSLVTSYKALITVSAKLIAYSKSLNINLTTVFNTFNKIESTLSKTHSARIKRLNQTKAAIDGVAKSLDSVNKTMEKRLELQNEQNRLTFLKPMQGLMDFMGGASQSMSSAVKDSNAQSQAFMERIFERNSITNNSTHSNSVSNSTNQDNRNISYASNNPTIQFNSKVVFMLPNGQQLEGWMMSEPS